MTASERFSSLEYSYPQYYNDRYYESSSTAGYHINEAEAYDHELDLALNKGNPFGLTNYEIGEIERRRNEEHYNLLPPEVQTSVDNGVYTLPFDAPVITPSSPNRPLYY